MIKLASILLFGFALTEMVAPVQATTFAGFVGLSPFSLISGSNTIAGSGMVVFTYYVGNGSTLTVGSGELATLSFTATSTLSGNCSVSDATCSVASSSYTEPGFSGTFKITDNSGGGNLLSGTFSMAQFSSFVGSSGALAHPTMLQASSANPSQMVFTSDYLNFADTITRNSTFSLASLTPLFSVLGNPGNQFPIGFSAMGTGAFTDFEVPEPSTYALLASGLLGLCLWQRKRRQLHR